MARRRRSRRRVPLQDGARAAVERLAGRHADRDRRRRAGGHRRARSRGIPTARRSRAGCGRGSSTSPATSTRSRCPARGRMPREPRHDEGEADFGRLRDAERREGRRRDDSERRLGVRGLPDRCRFPGTPDPHARLPEERLRSRARCTSSSTRRRIRTCSASAWRRCATSCRSSATRRRTRRARRIRSPARCRTSIAMGNSQSGRFAKAFLNLGFNED